MAKSNKKPTIMEMKTVVTNILNHMSYLENAVRSIDNAFASYMEFRGDQKEWLEWIKEKGDKLKQKEQDESRSKESGDIIGTADNGTAGKQASEK